MIWSPIPIDPINSIDELIDYHNLCIRDLIEMKQDNLKFDFQSSQGACDIPVGTNDPDVAAKYEYMEFDESYNEALEMEQRCLSMCPTNV